MLVVAGALVVGLVVAILVGGVVLAALGFWGWPGGFHCGGGYFHHGFMTGGHGSGFYECPYHDEGGESRVPYVGSVIT